MKENRGWLIALGCVGAFLLACCVGTIVVAVVYQDQFTDFVSMYAPTEPISSTSLPTPEGTAAAPEFALGDMEALIAEHDGQPCPDSDTLTCITLSMPLDHNDSSNTKTVDVTFGIHPAEGERFGMFVQAFPGGPGGAGIGSAGSRVEKFDEKVLAHYDIVFFDQRGVGLSSPLSCPVALETYFSDGFSDEDTQGDEGADTPEEQKEAVDGAKKFADDCVAEIGIDPNEIQLYDTAAVVEDIDNFREAVGDEKFYIYGVSYGTTVSQMYAAAHGEHLAGMVIDGVVDLTLNGQSHDHAQTKAFGKVLLATLEACNQDAECSDDFGGDDALKAYDDLAAQVAETPAVFDFPLPDGTSAERNMTFSKLETAATFSMYSQAARMIFLRALASAHRGDMVPMARLLYALEDIDPATERYVGDPDFSYTDFFIVNCSEVNYFTGTPDERIQALIEDSEGSYGLTPRLDSGTLGDAACVFWPNSPSEDATDPPLKAEGIPTLVLNATLDPATPYENGVAVAGRLADGYHIWVDGGEHGVYLAEEACPDDYVTNFLVNGQLPSERDIKCTWETEVIWGYQQPNKMTASQLTVDDIPQFMLTTDFDILFTPEFLFDSGKQGKIETACPYGGKMAFELDKEAKMENFEFTDCEYTEGFAMTGTGYFNVDNGDRGLDVDVSGVKSGHINFELIIDPQSISVTGTYGGQTVNFVR